MNPVAKKSKCENRPLFLEISEESYSLLMKGQIPKSLEKIKEAETQLYRQVSRSAKNKLKVEISNMYYIKGLILDRMQDLEKSKLAYLDAYQLNPKNKSICNNLGKVELQLNHYENAEHYLMQALQLDDKLLQAYVNLAFLYFETRRLDACIWISEEAQKRNIHDYMLSEYLGVCHAQLHQNYKVSLEHLGEYLLSCTKNGFKPSFLSLLYSALGNYQESMYQEAMAQMEKIAQLYPSEKDSLFLRAQILFQLDRVEEAEDSILEFASMSNLPLSILDLNQKEQVEDIPEQLKQLQLESIDLQNQAILDEKNEDKSEANAQSEQFQLLIAESQQIEQVEITIIKENSACALINKSYSYKSMSGKSYELRHATNYEGRSNNQQMQLSFNFKPHVLSSLDALTEIDQLNVYFILGLVYMRKAVKNNSDSVFLEKSKKLFQKASELDGNKENMQILINEGMVQEQMGESEESFKTLESTLILHFEKSNDETYLNSESYHSINKILLHVFELTLLQRFQENLKKISLEKEIETMNTKVKKGIICLKSSAQEEQAYQQIDGTSSIYNLQAVNYSNLSNNTTPSFQQNFGSTMSTHHQKRTASLNILMNTKQELERPIKLLGIDISRTIKEVMETLVEQLKGLNKQKLIKTQIQDKFFGNTLIDQDSFISNPLPLNNAISSNSQIGEEYANKSNLKASYLKSCENLEDEEHKVSIFCEDIREEEIGSYDGEENATPNSQGNDIEDKNVCQCQSLDTQDGENIEVMKALSNKSKKCNKCGKSEIIDEEEDDEEEVNEEAKQQKLREQEKESIIKKAKQTYEQEMKENNNKIQQLKLQASKQKEQEYITERLKHYSPIKNIQKLIDDLSYKSRILLGLYNPSLFFTPECTSCANTSLEIRQSDKNTPAPTGWTESPRDGSTSSTRSVQKREEQRNSDTRIQQQQYMKAKSSLNLERQTNLAHCTTKDSSLGNSGAQKQRCKCEEIRQQVESFSAFIKENNEQRDFFYGFKRIMRTVFKASRNIIDLSYYKQRNITITSLAEMSLGLIPLFQPDMRNLDASNTQMNIINNEELVKKCYFVISLANSFEDLVSMLDSLSSTLCVFLSPYIRDFVLNPSAIEFAQHMKLVLPVLKNYYEISFDQAGELFSFFIFYQFFTKLASNESEQLKYKALHLSDRSKFLFNFIRQNVRFSPSEFFIIKTNSIPPPKNQVAKSLQLDSDQNNNTHNRSSISNNLRNSYNNSSSDLSSILKKNRSKKDKMQNPDKCFCTIF